MRTELEYACKVDELMDRIDALEKENKELRKMAKEKKVYVIFLDDAEDFDFRRHEHRGEYDVIMDKAEELGSVWSLEGFQDALNYEDIVLDNAFLIIK